MISGRRLKRICTNGDETDMYSTWRYYLRWQAGVRKKARRRTNKRERREARDEIERERNE